MREIKFRAFIKEEYEMYPVVYLSITDEEGQNVGTANCRKEGCVICTEFYDLEEVELMQYTGFKDSNDKEIYEADILNTGLGAMYVKFEDGVYWLYSKKGRQQSSLYYYAHQNVVKVIGNVFENPELLEGNKNE